MPAAAARAGRLVVAQAELQPDRLRAERDRLVDDGGHGLEPPEHVDDLERPGTSASVGTAGMPSTSSTVGLTGITS